MSAREWMLGGWLEHHADKEPAVLGLDPDGVRAWLARPWRAYDGVHHHSHRTREEAEAAIRRRWEYAHR